MDWFAKGKQDAIDRLAKGDVSDEDLARTARVWAASPGVYHPRTYGYMQHMYDEASKRGLLDEAG